MVLGRALLFCVLAVLAIPPASGAQADFVTLEDRFVDIAMSDLVATSGCGASGVANNSLNATVTFDEEQDSFTFSEGRFEGGLENLPAGLGDQAGATRAVCATVSVVLPVPAETEHIHVRFEADRRVTQAVTLTYHMPQQLRIVDDANGRMLYDVDVFIWDEGSRDRTRFANLGAGVLGYFPLPPGLETVRLEWFFEDEGQTRDRGQDNIVSGQGFDATVWDPVAEFSSRPRVVGDAAHTQHREGLTVSKDTSIPIDYDPQGNQTNWRVRAPLDSVFSYILTPDGQRIDRTGNILDGGEYGPDLDFIIVDRFSAEGYVELTIPDRVMAPTGPGEYRVVFTETTMATPERGIMAFNAALAAIPLAFAAMALQRIREFQREAFGGYRRTARNLMVTLVLVLAYYVAAMVGAVIAGWFTVAALLPPTADSVLLYLQVFLAMAAFWWLWLTGREMYRIVRPAS